MSKRLKILVISVVALVMVAIYPIPIFICTFVSHKVYDEIGNPVSGVTVTRSYSFPLYGIDSAPFQTAVTDENGRAYIPQVFRGVPIWRYLYGTTVFLLTHPCECCLLDTMDYIDVEQIKVKSNEVAYLNSKRQLGSVITVVQKRPKVDSCDIDWAGIDESKIMAQAIAVWRNGPVRCLDYNYWGEMAKFKPHNIAVFEKNVSVRYSDGSGYNIHIVRGKNFGISDDDKTPFEFVSHYKKQF